MSDERRAARLVLVLALLLPLALLGAVLDAPTRLAVGAPDIDAPAGIWSLWWATRPQAAALVNHPYGDVEFHLLTPVSLALAHLLSPLGLAGVVLAWNLAVALAVAVAVGAGALLGRQQGGPWGAVVGALLLGTSPVLSAAARDGTGEFTWIGALAVALWATGRLARPRAGPADPGAVVLAGLALAASALSCWYYGLAAGIGALLLALVGPAPRRALPRVVAAGGLGLLLVLPVAAAFAGSDLEPARLRGADLLDHLLHGAPGPEPDHDALALPLLRRTQLVGAGDAPQWLWGLSLATLAALALGRAARGDAARALVAWLVVAATGLVLSLGSATPGGLPLPMLWLNRALSWVGTPLHLPFHLGALTTVAGVAAAARGVAVAPRVGAFAALLAVLSLVGPGRPLPLPVLRLEQPAPLRAVAEAGEGAVLDVPGVLSDAQEVLDTEALHQVVHGRPIPRFPVFPTSLYRSEGIAAVRRSALVQALADPGGPAPGTADLEAAGFRWVVLDVGRGPQLVKALDGWLGPPWAEGDGLRVYRLGGR